MFKLEKNKVTFNKGTKPRSLKAMQRETRSFYGMLCEAALPRSLSVAKVMLFRDVIRMSSDEVAKASPTLIHAIDSALRAYTAVGSDLMRIKQMYSMDMDVPVEELSFYKDLPKPVLDAVREAGLVDVKFSARES